MKLYRERLKGNRKVLRLLFYPVRSLPFSISSRFLFREDRETDQFGDLNVKTGALTDVQNRVPANAFGEPAVTEAGPPKGVEV